MQYVHNTSDTQNLSDSELIAYHAGYQAGYEFGVLDATYDNDSTLRAAYCKGYDSGVLAFWAEIDEGASPD